MNKNKSASLLFTIVLASSSLAQANTLAFWNGNEHAKVVARTMDLKENESPLLRSSPRGITRIGDLSNNHLSWQSKYGSIVVTAFNTNAATDGINEAGLAVHILPVTEAQYGARDTTLPALSNALWVQYMLDNFQTVEEALASLGQYQIIETKILDKELPSHMALQDATGDSAIIEFVNGQPIIYHGAEFNVMTNRPSNEHQINSLRQYKTFGGELALPGDVDPNSRFIRASSFLKTLPTPTNSAEALAGIDSVIRTTMVPYGAELWPTRWVATSDLTNQVFYFKSTSQPGAVWVDLKKMPFKEGNIVMYFDPKQNHSTGDVTKHFKKVVDPT